ncbi:MAG TPA: anhydro-N-acetylmuramic acid kinase [Casimicrobiaceae bacterium]|nr:anhydro-N-acetylmuramic acid kinase [Casimicrobiaceae bacterium]
MRQIVAGVMSGTSLDGVDAVIADFAPTAGGTCRVLVAAHIPFAPELRTELLALQRATSDELARSARAACALADVYATGILAALAEAGLDADDVIAAGVHGQTVRHRPDEGWTLQLNNPARVAERAGVTVVADFRSRDVAAGGQGAPLVPAFHAALFRSRAHRVVVNLGGIANVTDLPPQGPVRGFDTGPGNALLDLWHERHRKASFDRDGAWSRSGRIDEALLAALLAEPYFARNPPKSTGRDLFNAGWLDARLGGRAIAPADVQATLVALTARAIADAIRTHCVQATEMLVCGGGAKNAALMEALGRELAPRAVRTTAALGVAVEHVEALAFAWLAREALAHRPGNLPEVTGARGLRVLGAIYPR